MARVALLLLKGLSHKEIATVCAVSERTVWEQARSISSKAGLTGRTACRRSPSRTCSPHRRPGIAAGRCGCNGPPDAPKRTRRTGLSDWVLACALGLLHPGLTAHAGDAPCASPTRVRPYGGCARGSGDPTPETGTNRSFRQTGLEAHQAGFGSVERFPHYGMLLDPELCNR